MTRKSKISFLLRRNEKIEYHFRESDNRLIIDSIWSDGHWETYRICTEDQVKAGQLIDVMYWEWTR